MRRDASELAHRLARGQQRISPGVYAIIRDATRKNPNLLLLVAGVQE